MDIEIKIDHEELLRVKELNKKIKMENSLLSQDFISFDFGNPKPSSNTMEAIQEPPIKSISRPPPKKVEHVLRYNVPWMLKLSSDDCDNTNYEPKRDYSSDPTERLHQEIEDFSNYVSPTEEERFARSEAIRRLQEIVIGIWPTASVLPFGSYDSGLFLPSSDLDIVIMLTTDSGERVIIDELAKPPLRRLGRALKRSGIILDGSLQIIDKARIPILKYSDHQTDFMIDVSFNVSSGLEAASFMRGWMKRESSIRPLTLLLKRFLGMRKLNEVFTGGLGSFAIMCLVVHFLQAHPLIQGKLIRADDNLGVIFMELLEYYGKNLSMEHVAISLRGNRFTYSKDEKHPFYQERRPNSLSMDDPQTPIEWENDVTRGSFSIGPVRQTMEHAFNILKVAFNEFRSTSNSSTECPSILGSIVDLDDRLLRHRFFIQQTNSNI